MARQGEVMPTYTYEVISTGERFEVSQKMADAKLECHPESGLPVRKILVAGTAIRYTGLREHVKVNKALPAATACGCASNSALAKQMFANSRTTPKFGSIESKRTVVGGVAMKSSSPHGHSHSGGCCGGKH